MPPNIEPSAVDLAIPENSSASLECLASGLPAPGESILSSAPVCEPPGLSLGQQRRSPQLSSLCFPADITWYKGQERLRAGAGLALSGDGKRLELPRARLSDAGSYRCVASNAAGLAELRYSLQVTGECSCGAFLRDGGSPLEYRVGPVGLSQPSGCIPGRWLVCNSSHTIPK